MNKVIIGDFTATDERILDGSAVIEDALAAEELRIDKMDVTLDGAKELPTLFLPADADGLLTKDDKLFGIWPWFRVLVDDFSIFAYGEPVWYWHGDKLLGKFYMETVDRIGPYSFAITCTSAIGLLENSQHYGGIYTGQTAGAIIRDVIGGAVEYTLDKRLESIPMYGWLPVATRRENLHQALFALGAIAAKDTIGTLTITVLEKGEPSVLGERRVVLGGSVEYQTPASQVLISEHAYTAYKTDEDKTLFEGEVAAEPIITPKGQSVTGVLVVYDGPMHDVSVSNGSILEQGVNYAVLGQSSDCKLTGKAYTHTIRVISATPGSDADAQALTDRTDNIVKVENATLVSLANSENVAARMAAYYASTKTISNAIIVGDERPGATVQFEDPFGDDTVGFLSSMTLNMSNTLTADTEILSGYAPTDFGNYYQHSKVILTSQTFTVPEEARDKLRVVLIGGGDGGSPGSAGEKGVGGSWSEGYGSSGPGGAGGRRGAGGKTYSVTIAATPGDTYRASIGPGGASGSRGSASTFGPYSSDSGQSSESGFTDLFTGTIYATPGEDGIAGGSGVDADSGSTTVYYNGRAYISGANGAGRRESGLTGYGGLGGGPAAGVNGGAGGDAKFTSKKNDFMDGGDGGKGATPVSGLSATVRGAGGNGGHGGGGGGGGGGVAGSHTYTWPGSGGAGGSGSSGGRGADGLIILYW